MNIDHRNSDNAIPSDWFYRQPRVIVLIILINIATGFLYLIQQWITTNDIIDSFFVGLLLGATLLLLQGIHYMHAFVLKDILSFFIPIKSEIDYKEMTQIAKEFIRSIFNNAYMTLSGCVYGLIISLAVYSLNVWQQHQSLNIFLSLFIFTINFVTGLGFYGLIVFFKKSVMLSKIIKVDLWQTENPSTVFLRKLTVRTAMLASFYICICIGSIYFSILPLGSLTIGYSIFSGVIIVIAFILPEIPILKKVAESRSKVLAELNNQIQIEFKRAFGKDNNYDNLDISRLETLLKFKEKIETINIWPFKIKIITTSFSVLFVTFLPVLLKVVLERIFKSVF